MEKTIVLTVDYKLNRYSWNDQIGFSGGQPFGTNPATSFDIVYDLLRAHGYGDIIYNIEREGVKETLTLKDLVPLDEIKKIVEHEEYIEGFEVGELVVFKKAQQNFNGQIINASKAIGKIKQIDEKDYLIEFEDDSFFPLRLRNKSTWSINKFLVKRK